MTMPAYPRTRAFHLHHLRHDVAELLERAERLARGRGTEGHDLEHDELEAWFATIPIHDTLRSTLSAPWSADDPIDADNALHWLHQLVGAAETNGQDPIPPGWEEHVERLSTPKAIGALREILERLEPIRPAESLPGCPEAGPLRAPLGAAARPLPPVADSLTLDDRAVALLTRWLREGREKLSKRKLAEALGCHPSSLRDCPTFNRLWESSKASPRRGFQDARNGRLEAVDDD